MIYIKGPERDYIISPTIFPDKTSQVWKVDEEVFNLNKIDIIWSFEDESELIHVCQLANLIEIQGKSANLHLPYFPYARQDKDISNNTTFSLYTFCMILNTLKNITIVSMDVHNYEKTKHFLNKFEMVPCDLSFCSVYDYVIFPDSGAKARYEHLVKNENIISCTKERNQATGYIEKFILPVNSISHKTCVVVDDICDGGKTFEILAESVRDEYENVTLDLYVSHGLFTKGREKLESLYNNIIVGVYPYA